MKWHVARAALFCSTFPLACARPSQPRPARPVSCGDGPWGTHVDATSHRLWQVLASVARQHPIPDRGVLFCRDGGVVVVGGVLGGGWRGDGGDLSEAAVAVGC